MLEADSADMMKESVMTAVKLVLDMEGHSGRIQNVVQLASDLSVTFCAINAQIAKQLGKLFWNFTI